MNKIIIHSIFWCSLASGQGSFFPPSASQSALSGVVFKGEPVGEVFKARFQECDKNDTCDGKSLRHGCRSDPNNNSTLLKLKGGVLFYDAKMGIDMDGSPYSQKTAGPTDQPETSLRYPLPGRPSVNADGVPYIVIPLGGFDKALGVQLGDVTAVVWGAKRVYAVVADEGPPCKIGEGSLKLHEVLGHRACKQRTANGDCEKIRDVGIDKDILYFIFPGTHRDLLPQLTPENIGSRIEAIGAREWQKLTAR